MTTQNMTSGRPEVDAALVLLAKLGVSPADLIAGVAAARPPVPTFAEFIPRVVAATTAGALKAYGPYWKRIGEHWASRRLDEPGPVGVERRGERLRAGRGGRPNGPGGAGAGGEERPAGGRRRSGGG